MKKTLMLTLMLVIALGLTIPAFAVHPDQASETVPLIGKTTIEVGGSLRFRGDYRSKIIASDTSGQIDNKADYDGRVRLWLNAYVSDKTVGRFQLETGNNNASDGYQWGCQDRDPDFKNADYPSDSAGTYQEGNCKKDELRVLEAWIKSDELFGSPLGLKVGHMPIKLGRGLFLLHTRFGDDAINFYMPLMDDKLLIDFVMTKFTEGSNTMASDDTDTYTGIVHYDADMFKIATDLTYLLDRNVPNPQNGIKAGAGLWNWGINAEGDAGPVNIYGDIEFQFGEVKAVGTAAKQKFKGYAALLGVLGKLQQVNLLGEFGYGSGDNDPNDNDIKEFQTALSSVKKFTYVYDYRQMTASNTGRNNTGIANTTYFRLGGSGKPMPELNWSADIYWLKASKKDAFDKDDLGWEIDGYLGYDIDKNLTYFIEGGILFTGNFYDNYTGTPGQNAKDAYIVRHGVQLAF